MKQSMKFVRHVLGDSLDLYAFYIDSSAIQGYYGHNFMNKLMHLACDSHPTEESAN